MFDCLGVFSTQPYYVHDQPLSTAFKYYSPVLATINRYEALSTTTNYYPFKLLSASI